jgi:dienelactone hydrolase
LSRAALALAALAAVSLALGDASATEAQGPGEPDCAGPAGDPRPGTAEWDKREDDNVYCAGQRVRDHSANPAYQQAQSERPPARSTTAMDPFREPTRWSGSRFRYEEVSFGDAGGKRFPGFLFRPCDASCRDRPPGLGTFEPPYPGVVIMHGGAANQEMYFWAAQGLAEAGYMVLTFSIGRTADSHYEDTRSALDYFVSTPARPSPAGEVNPRWAELDRGRLGLAGHSAGGVAVSRLGQEDDRISAIVSWDRAQSSPMPERLRIRVPALFVVADFNCQRVPVCLPERRSTPPDPYGPGNKDEDYRRLSAAGVDTMKIALRAATHLDFTEWPEANGSRYGAVTTFYYTLAWFDRYLKGARDALTRLTATRFDSSADVHNVSGGTWDPATDRNVPPAIGGQRVADRLSFHFRSAYFLRGGRDRCEDMRAGCGRNNAASSLGCLARRSPIGRGGIGRVRLGLGRRALARRVPAPRRRTRRSWRWCVKGGGGTVRAVFSRRGRVVLVVTTARGHGNRGVRPGTASNRARRAYPRGRSAGRGLLRASGGSRLLIGSRGGRVRFVAVASRRLLGRPRALRRLLQASRSRAALAP